MRGTLTAQMLLAPTAAFAHTGIGAHGAPFASGFLHPFLGADHLLTMVSVGLVAGMTGGRALWTYPASFVAAMFAGGILGFEGTALPVVEPTILASVVVLGVAVALAVRPPPALACATIALFGLAHGYAHGLEAPGLGGLTYAAGFVIATASLHAVGLSIGLAAGRSDRPGLVRALGGLACAAGVFLVMN